jgi:two-component system chemotaxis response regulator CheB/chemosensory pili system protein ChpB (putative protein-glutamate methylesterase)
MPDRAKESQPRIALVFGEEAKAAHVREAMVGQVAITYASTAADFDAARLASAGATSALVNLDGDDWLDDVESALHAAGIAVVYNDPEISQSLDGWARARWLRHLVAKLSGSRDVDPPRPEAASRVAAAGPAEVTAELRQVATAVDESAAATAVDAAEAATPVAVVELPLSSEEIETMTVDFVDGQVSAPVPAGEPMATSAVDAARETGPASPDVPVQEAAVEPTLSFEPVPGASTETVAATHEQSAAIEPALTFEPAPDVPTETLAVVDESPDTDASQEIPAEFDFEAEAALDVDTEALSAMIDARLAEPESAHDQDSDQVWREVSGDSVPPAQQDKASEAEPMTPDTRIPEPAPASAASDDADVLASLPSLDDWALVDPDVAPASATGGGARKSPEPFLSDTFAGLELVPMETIVPLRVDADPIERWFGGSPGSKAGANDSAESKMDEVSHEHG